MTIIRTYKRMRPRHKSDYYPTPIEACKAALSLVSPEGKAFILDPGAGNGVWGKAWIDLHGSDAYLVGVEKEDFLPEKGIYDIWYNTDFIGWKHLWDFDLVMGNPPYSLAEEFLRHSYSMLSKHGTILFLYRLAFLEGQARGKGLWQELPPKKIWVYSRRPSFLGDVNNRGTDDNAYCVYLWKKGYKGKTTIGWLGFEYE